MATGVDGHHIGQTKVELEVWIDKWRHEAA